jgi:hypothetical protein
VWWNGQVRRNPIIVLVIALFLSGFSFVASSSLSAAQMTSLCSSSDLRITPHGFLAGTGSVNNLFWIRNVGGSSCSLRGYPGVTFLGSRAAQLEVKQTNTANRNFNDVGGLRRGVTLPTVVLAANGGIASFMIYGTDEQHGNPPTKCIETRKMLVSIPNVVGRFTILMRVGSAFYWCGGIAMHPIVPGRTGADPPIALLPG